MRLDLALERDRRRERLVAERKVQSPDGVVCLGVPGDEPSPTTFLSPSDLGEFQRLRDALTAVLGQNCKQAVLVETGRSESVQSGEAHDKTPMEGDKGAFRSISHIDVKPCLLG